MDERPPEVGWLQYRLAVAFCSGVLASIMLLLAPWVASLVTPGMEGLTLYKYVFSVWGFAVLCGFSLLGFIVGGERMADTFAFMWGTHPAWSKAAEWLGEHEIVGAALALAVLLSITLLAYYLTR